MDWLKVGGGAAAGVGTVAMLPVMGAIGSVSLFGALLGGTLGGPAGAAMVERDEEDKDAAPIDPSDAMAASACQEADGLADMLQMAREKVLDDAAYSRLVLALSAYGMASAHAQVFPDDAVSARIDRLASLAEKAGLAGAALEQVEQFRREPPAFTQAVDLALGLAGPELAIFRELMHEFAGDESNP